MGQESSRSSYCCWTFLLAAVEKFVGDAHSLKVLSMPASLGRPMEQKGSIKGDSEMEVYLPVSEDGYTAV